MQRLGKRGLLVLTMLALFAIPVAVSAAGGFTDVPDDHTFKADIDWLAANGVTKGCNPPANTEFCPDSPVTRGQMAAFIHRLADGIVRAKTAISADKAAKADYATTAGNADTLDGRDSSDFLATSTQPTATGDSYTSFLSTTALSGIGTIEQVTVTAPQDGYLFVSASATFGTVAEAKTLVWMQLDNSVCDNNIEVVVPGGYAYAQGNGPISVSFSQIFAASGGDHTVTLCGNAYSGDLNQTISTAGVQTLWIASGELTTNLNSATTGAIPGTSG